MVEATIPAKSGSADFMADGKVRKLVKKCPLFLDAEDETHVLVFRKILEVSLSQGRWSGEMPRIS